MPAIFPKWTNWLPLQIGVVLALAWLLKPYQCSRKIF
jgi:hypothetical protein